MYVENVFEVVYKKSTTYLEILTNIRYKECIFSPHTKKTTTLSSDRYESWN